MHYNCTIMSCMYCYYYKLCYSTLIDDEARSKRLET